jgi:hypothetical protein
MFEQTGVQCVLVREKPAMKRNITSVMYKNKIEVNQLDRNYLTFAVTLSVSRIGKHQLIAGKIYSEVYIHYRWHKLQLYHNATFADRSH